MKLTPRARAGEGRTTLMLVALVVGLVVAEVASRFNPGPDWFDTSDFPHVDAFLVGLASGLLVAMAAAWVRCRLHRRPQ